MKLIIKAVFFFESISDLAEDDGLTDLKLLNWMIEKKSPRRSSSRMATMAVLSCSILRPAIELLRSSTNTTCLGSTLRAVGAKWCAKKPSCTCVQFKLSVWV